LVNNTHLRIENFDESKEELYESFKKDYLDGMTTTELIDKYNKPYNIIDKFRSFIIEKEGLY